MFASQYLSFTSISLLTFLSCRLLMHWYSHPGLTPKNQPKAKVTDYQRSPRMTLNVFTLRTLQLYQKSFNMYFFLSFFCIIFLQVLHWGLWVAVGVNGCLTLCVSPVFWLTTCPRCSPHLTQCRLGSGSRPFPRRDDSRIDYWSGIYNLLEHKDVLGKKTFSLCLWTLSLCQGYSIHKYYNVRNVRQRRCWTQWQH